MTEHITFEKVKSGHCGCNIDFSEIRTISASRKPALCIADINH